MDIPTPVHTAENWWTRPCGGREVLKLALPLVMSSLSWTLLTFIDRMFLMWNSKDALAASFPAALLWWNSLCLPMGICMYVSTFVSQYYGSGSDRWIGPAVWQGIWLALGTTPLVLLVLPVAPAIFSAAGHAPGVMEKEIVYFKLLCIGSPAMLLSYACSSFYTGQGKSWVVMVIDAIATALNIVLDYLWIFGLAGFPAWGIAGAAVATAISFWFKVILYGCLLFRRQNRARFHTHHAAFNRRLFGRLIYFGGPSGLQMFLEILGFTAFIMLVGSIGTTQLTATTLAFNVSTLAFMPVFGLATAASIMVGQQLGADRPDLAERATWATLWSAIGYMGLISLMYVVVPDLFLFGFFAASEIEDSEYIHGMAVVLLRYVAAYNIFDALNLVFAFAVKGAGDSMFVMIVSLVMAAALAGGAWIGVRYLHFGLHGSWLLITAWVVVLGLIYLARFLQGKWRTMRVI